MIDGGHIDDQAAARALRALTPEEERQVDEHADTCPSCKDKLREAEAAAHLLSFVAQPARPPRHCKARLMEKVARETFLRQPSRRQTGLASWALYAAAAAVFIVMGGWNMRLQYDLRRQQEVMQALTSDPQPIALKPHGDKHGRVVAQMFEAPTGTDGVLVIHNLGPAPKGKVYQIWVANDAGQQAMETFQPRKSPETVMMHSSKPWKIFKQIMVTIENEGGSQVPSQQTVLSGDL